MTISIHAQTKFDNYDFFKTIMDDILSKYPSITKCLTDRTTPTHFAEKYFADKNIICEQPKLSNIKIQRQYKLVEESDLSIFFYNDNIKSSFNITGKTISRAKTLNKNFLIFDYLG